MLMRSNILLQSASILALSTGLALAQDNSGTTREDVAEEIVDAVPNDESVPDVEEGMVTTPDDPIVVDAEVNMNNEAMAEWRLANYQGAEVWDEGGNVIGTIVGVVNDATDRIFFVTSMHAMPEEGQERAVPMEHFWVDESDNSLRVNAETNARIEAMSPFNINNDRYMQIESDEQWTEAYARAQARAEAGN